MPFFYDPEVGAGLAALFAAAGDAPLPPVGDVAGRRTNVEGLQGAIHGLLPMPDDVTIRGGVPLRTRVPRAHARHHVSPYGAAGRLEDFAGLPPAYIEVGELDIFRDEDIAYAQRLLAAGISTELHLHPDVPHAFEALVPTAAIAQRSAADRHRLLGRL